MSIPAPKQDFYEDTIPESSMPRDRKDLIYALMRIDDLSYPDAERRVDEGKLTHGQLETIIRRHSGVDV